MKVLLVEDNLADARLVQEILREADPMGFDLAHCRGLGDALNLLGFEKVDAVLLDLGLPDARGLEALIPIRQADPDIPVVVLSAHADENLAIEAVQNGAQDYLLKGRGDGALLARALRYAVERKRAELRIRHLAHYDALTDLPNRRLLLDRLGQALARTRRERKMLALLFLDLDHFKVINDTLGHAAGDELLKAVAARLLGCMRECDTVARLSGDEFTLVLPEVSHVEDTSRFAVKVLQALHGPFYIAGREEFISASIGIGLYPNDGDSVEALLRCADAAMYQAKRQGRNRYQFHSDAHDARFPSG